MKNEKTFSKTQIKKLKEWLLSEIEKVTKDINSYYSSSNYYKAKRAEAARDAYYKCINEITT